MGNGGSGTSRYPDYERDYELAGPPETPKPGILGSSDPSFRGKRSRWNPEELFVSSISSCHMLWYLHLCADAGIVVTSYRDRPLARMIEDDTGGGVFESVLLRPVVTIAGDSGLSAATDLHARAHEKCFIAASVRVPIAVEPTTRSTRISRLNELTPWGRSYSEYEAMFGLGSEDLSGSILGCGDGPASFNAEIAKVGGRVVSVDPLYAFTREEISRRIGEISPAILDNLRANRDWYRWERWRTPEELVSARLAALEEFLIDYEDGRRQARYRFGVLPNLPFASNSFDLALVAHFLFLQAEELDYRFHLESLFELLRVATEVRVFPVVDTRGERYRHIDRVLEDLRRGGATAPSSTLPTRCSAAPPSICVSDRVWGRRRGLEAATCIPVSSEYCVSPSARTPAIFCPCCPTNTSGGSSIDGAKIRSIKTTFPAGFGNRRRKRKRNGNDSLFCGAYFAGELSDPPKSALNLRRPPSRVYPKAVPIASSQ